MTHTTTRPRLDPAGWYGRALLARLLGLGRTEIDGAVAGGELAERERPGGMRLVGGAEALAWLARRKGPPAEG